MTATRTLPGPVQSPPGRSWSTLAVLMIGTFMFVLDFFIVNVALPAIQQGLRAGEGAIEWIVAGYAISTAVLLVTGGRGRGHATPRPGVRRPVSGLRRFSPACAPVVPPPPAR